MTYERFHDIMYQTKEKRYTMEVTSFQVAMLQGMMKAFVDHPECVKVLNKATIELMRQTQRQLFDILREAGCTKSECDNMSWEIEEL